MAVAACFDETASATVSGNSSWTWPPPSFPGGVYVVVADDEEGGLAVPRLAVSSRALQQARLFGTKNGKELTPKL